jgi:hypothetical protein
MEYVRTYLDDLLLGTNNHFQTTDKVRENSSKTLQQVQTTMVVFLVTFYQIMLESSHSDVDFG